MLCLERCTVWLRDLDINNIGAEVIGALRNVVLEENGEDKIVRDSVLTSKLNIELRNKLVLILCLEHSFIWLRDLDTKKIAVEVFGELRNVVLEENGEDKMVRESN